MLLVWVQGFLASFRGCLKNQRLFETVEEGVQLRQIAAQIESIASDNPGKGGFQTRSCQDRRL